MPLPEIKEERSAPYFTFPLRPRLIQKNHGCKLICTVTGGPLPTVVWTKDGQQVDAGKYLIEEFWHPVFIFRPDANPVQERCLHSWNLQRQDGRRRSLPMRSQQWFGTHRDQMQINRSEKSATGRSSRVLSYAFSVVCPSSNYTIVVDS
jgi:hypothetical protein